MGVSVGVLDHFNIRTRNLADTVRFYEDVLGLEKGPRPNFAFPGAWMYSEGKAVVHLVDISKTDEAQKPDSGVVHHVAFASTGFDGMKQRLQSKGMPFDMGALLKEVLAKLGGRGGGSKDMAQGGAPHAEALEAALNELARKLRD